MGLWSLLDDRILRRRTMRLRESPAPCMSEGTSTPASAPAATRTAVHLKHHRRREEHATESATTVVFSNARRAGQGVIKLEAPSDNGGLHFVGSLHHHTPALSSNKRPARSMTYTRATVPVARLEYVGQQRACTARARVRLTEKCARYTAHAGGGTSTRHVANTPLFSHE